ncbi:MAG: chemotaxis protein CheW [Alphaproteobacteria bacterium]
MSANQTKRPSAEREGAEAASGHLISVTVGGQLFGIPVLQAQDVLNPQRIVRIPLAPAAIAGSLNLRGRIVTAIDLRSCLGLPACPDPSASMSVVTEREGELYSLLVDSVGEVMTLSPDSFEQTPGTLRQLWREVCDGIYRLDGQLLLVLNVGRVLDGLRTADAA